MSKLALEDIVIMQREDFLAAEDNLQATIEELELNGHVVFRIEPNNPRSQHFHWKILTSKTNVVHD